MAEIVIKLVNGELAGKTAQELQKNITACAQAAKKAQIGTQEWMDANEKLTNAKALQEDYKNQLDSTTKASNGLKSSFMSILDKIPGFSQISGAMQSAQGGVGGLTSGFGLLKGAIASTGIGLLVLAVGALIVAFTKFTPLMDKVEQVFGGVGQVLDVIINRIIDFGKGLIDIVSGNWEDGVNKISSSFDNLGGAMKGAYVAGTELKKLQQDLEDSARGIDIANARAEASVNRLIVAAKNKSLSDQEQNKILLQARKIAEENFAANDAQKQKEFELLIDEAQQKSKLSKEEILQLTEGTLAQKIEYEKRGTIGDDLLDKIKDAQIERINAEGQTGKLLEKIQNAQDLNDQQRAALEQKRADDRKKLTDKEIEDKKKAADEKLKIQQEEQKADDNILALRAENQQKGEQKEIDAINAETQKKIDSLIGSEAQITEQRTLLEEIAQGKIQDVKDKYAKEAVQKAMEQATKDSDLQLANDQSILTEQYLAKQVTQSQFIAASEQAVRSSEQRKLAIIKKSLGEESKEYQAQYKKILDSEVKFAEDHSKDVMKVTLATVNTLGNIFGVLASTMAEGSEDQKNMMVAQAVMQTISGSINAYTGTLASVPEPFGLILAPINAAIAFATGMVNVNKIKSTPIPTPTVAKAQYGMVLNGPSHAQGGIPIEAEGDEIIMTKGVYQNPYLRNLASQINSAAGGIRFDSGGPVNPYRDSSRPPISGNNNSSLGSLTPQIDYERLAFELNKHVDNKIMKIEVHQNLQETQKGLDKIKTIQDLSNV